MLLLITEYKSKDGKSNLEALVERCLVGEKTLVNLSEYIPELPPER